jgi:GAF domain-containing protein
LEETRVALAEVEAAHRTYLRDEWETFLASREGQEAMGYVLTREGPAPAPQIWSREIELAVQKSQAVTTTDASDTPAAGQNGESDSWSWSRSYRREGEEVIKACSALAAPITLRGQVIGALDLFDPEHPREWSEDDVALVEAVTSQVALAVENARLFEKTQTSLAETEVLYNVSRQLNAAESYDDILSALRTYPLFGRAHHISLNVFDRPPTGEGEGPEWFIPIARQSTLAPDSFPSSRLPPRGTDVAGPCQERYPHQAFPSASQFLRPEPTLIEDVENDPLLDDAARRLLKESFKASSTMFLPLEVGGQWIGFIHAVYREPTRFPEDEVRRLAALSGQAAIAVQNLRQLREIEARARREAIIREISSKVSSSMDLKTVLQTTARELSVALGAPQAIIHMRTQPGEPAPDSHVSREEGEETARPEEPGPDEPIVEA